MCIIRLHTNQRQGDKLSRQVPDPLAAGRQTGKTAEKQAKNKQKRVCHRRKSGRGMAGRIDKVEGGRNGKEDAARFRTPRPTDQTMPMRSHKPRLQALPSRLRQLCFGLLPIQQIRKRQRNCRTPKGRLRRRNRKRPNTKAAKELPHSKRASLLNSVSIPGHKPFPKDQ